jgi:hypothetical protein
LRLHKRSGIFRASRRRRSSLPAAFGVRVEAIAVSRPLGHPNFRSLSPGQERVLARLANADGDLEAASWLLESASTAFVPIGAKLKYSSSKQNQAGDVLTASSSLTTQEGQATDAHAHDPRCILDS